MTAMVCRASLSGVDAGAELACGDAAPETVGHGRPQLAVAAGGPGSGRMAGRDRLTYEHGEQPGDVADAGVAVHDPGEVAEIGNTLPAARDFPTRLTRVWATEPRLEPDHLAAARSIWLGPR